MKNFQTLFYFQNVVIVQNFDEMEDEMSAFDLILPQFVVLFSLFT